MPSALVGRPRHQVVCDRRPELVHPFAQPTARYHPRPSPADRSASRTPFGRTSKGCRHLPPFFRTGDQMRHARSELGGHAPRSSCCVAPSAEACSCSAYVETYVSVGKARVSSGGMLGTRRPGRGSTPCWSIIVRGGGAARRRRGTSRQLEGLRYRCRCSMRRRSRNVRLRRIKQHRDHKIRRLADKRATLGRVDRVSLQGLVR